MAGSTVGTGGGPPRSVSAVSLWRAKWIILAVIALAFVGGYQYSKEQPATYTAQSRVVLSAAQPFDPLGTYSGNEPTRYVADQVAIIDTQTILAPAAQQLAVQQPPDPIDGVALSGAITPEPSTTTSVIVINATASEPERAVARANVVAAAYQTYRADEVRRIADQSAAASTDLPTIEQIRAKAVAYGTGVATVENAAPGQASSSLAPMRSALLITAVAGLIAIGLALLWRSPPPDGSAVIAAARTRVLGRVPVRSPRRGSVSPQVHAHTLVALDYARKASPGPVLVTAGSARSGAASVAHGLAVSAAAQGRRVLLVDADPDRRELVPVGTTAPARSLEQLGHPGVSRDQVLVPVETSAGAQLLLAKVGTDGSPLLDSAAVGRALAELDGAFDLVLVQSGPVSRSPVAFALVEHVAAVVVVARDRDAARPVAELRDRLDATRRPLVGLVLTGRRLGVPWRPQAQPEAGVERAPEEPERRPAPPVEEREAGATAAPAPMSAPAQERDEELGASTR